jgi:uncharacterized membrane protein
LGNTMSANRRRGAAIGLTAAFLVSINTFSIQFAQEFRSYSLLFLLASLSTFFLIKAIESNESKNYWLTGYVLVTVASVYSHFHTAFLVLAQLVTLPVLILDKKRRYFTLKQFLYCGIGIACLVLPALIVSYIHGSRGITWITEPTLSTVKWFIICITGGWGKRLALLYLFFGIIGFLFGEGFLYRQDTITRWKFSLMASCLLTPVITVLIISKSIIPVFVDRYFIFVISYLAVLTAAGFVAFSSFIYKSGKYRLIFILAGIFIFALFTLFSAKGIQNYYNYFVKEDWRSTTVFLETKCSGSLRLYYPYILEKCVLYYNPGLDSQTSLSLKNLLKTNFDSKEFAPLLPNEYDQVCLVLNSLSDRHAKQTNIIRDVVQKQYPDKSTVIFEGTQIEIYKRSKSPDERAR